MDHAKAQAVSCQPIISEAWFQSLVSQQYFSFPLPLAFHQSSKSFIHLQLTLYNVTN